MKREGMTGIGSRKTSRPALSKPSIPLTAGRPRRALSSTPCLLFSAGSKAAPAGCSANLASFRRRSIPEQRMNSRGWRAKRQTRLTKKLKITALMMSTKKAPTKGTIKKALCESPNFCVMACMFATAVGVAPMPNPQWPAVKTTAS